MAPRDLMSLIKNVYDDTTLDTLRAFRFQSDYLDASKS